MKKTSQALSDILRPYANWFMEPDDPAQAEACHALLEFETAYRRVKPRRRPWRKYYHTEYLLSLCDARQALLERNYYRVCNELLTLLHGEYAEQPRIRAGILGLLSDEIPRAAPGKKIRRCLENKQLK